MMSLATVFCIIGYALVQAMILQATAAPRPGPEYFIGILGGAPVAIYCAKLDYEGR